MGDRLYHPLEWVIGGYNVLFLWESTMRMVVGFLAGLTDWVLLLQTGGRQVVTVYPSFGRENLKEVFPPQRPALYAKV